MAASFRNICVRDTCIGSTCTVDTWIRCADIGGAYTECIYARSIFAGSVEPRVLARSGVILVGPGINDNCFLSFMGLIFVLLEVVDLLRRIKIKLGFKKYPCI